MGRLGVNVDHVATLREARGTLYPNPLEAAIIAQSSGADQLTVHLREDRRHIQDEDVLNIKDFLKIPLNLECAATDEMLKFASELRPSMVTIVPEKREEKTTEGGLDLKKDFDRISLAVKALLPLGIPVSLFIEPSSEAIDLSLKSGAPMVELHTGKYSTLRDKTIIQSEIQRIDDAVQYAHSNKLTVHVGHGLNYQNVSPIAKIKNIQDFNIGHSIISCALFLGLEKAVTDMKKLLSQ